MMASMRQDVLNGWIAFRLLEIARVVHVGQDRIRAVRKAQVEPTRFLHRMGRPAKATPEIKQAVIERMLQHPNFSDFQVAQIIIPRFGIRITRPPISRLRHLAHFKFLLPKNREKLTEVQRRQRY
jgi:transposase